MPKVTHEKEMHLRNIIRDAKAIQPLISLRDLQRIVEKKINRPVDLYYLSVLVKKIAKQVLTEVDRSTIEEKVSQMRERNRILIEELTRMAFSTATGPDFVSTMDRRKAIELIHRIETVQAKLEMDFGIFERHIGIVGIDHRLKPIDDDTRSNIIQAFKAWGIKAPPMRKIEPMSVITVKSKEVPHEQPTTTTKPNTAPATTKPKPQPLPRVTNAGLVPTE